MIKSVAPYIGKYKKYTVFASFLTTLGIIANVVPYFILYQFIVPITQNQPLGNIKELGTGQIKRVFTDDIDQIELLLAHAIPEGIANITVPVVVIIAMFFVDWRLALFTLPFGGLLVLKGAINLSQLVLVLCMSFAVGPAILRALSFAGKIPQLDYKIAELEKMMKGEAIKAGKNEFVGKNYDVEFKDVKFSYKKSAVPEQVEGRQQEGILTLRNFRYKYRNGCVALNIPQMQIPVGKITAITGNNGEGKTTLLNCLCGFGHRSKGTLEYNGKTVIVVTHDRELIKECCDEEIRLREFNLI